MTTAGFNRTLLCLSLVVAAILVARAWKVNDLAKENPRLETIIMTYHNNSELCDRLGQAALNETNAPQAVELLRQLIPSMATPPWAEPPKNLDSAEGRVYDMMDRVRSHNQRAVISHLRRLTGADLGDDAKAWVEKYGRLEQKP